MYTSPKGGRGEKREAEEWRRKKRGEIKLYNDDVKSYIIFLGLRFKFIKKKKKRKRKKREKFM